MPKAFLEIKTYKELFDYIQAFREKKMNLMILVSRAGLGKTTIVEEALISEAPLILNSHITPLKFYENLFERTQEEPDCLVIIDEAEMMFSNPKLKTMLKILCDTRKEKTIRYITSSPILKDIPQEFTTEAKVIMLINTLRPTDEHIKAIMSRGHLLYFTPSDIEILNYLKTWAEDKEILDFLEKFAPFSRTLNLRTYVKAKESKDSGLDWQREVINELELDPRLLEIKRLLETYETDEERLKHWSNSRSGFYRFKKIYLSKNPPKKNV